MKSRLTFLVALLTVFLISCGGDSTNYNEEATADVVVEEVVIEDVWVVDEHSINDIPLTSHPDATADIAMAADEAEEADISEEGEEIEIEAEVEEAAEIEADMEIVYEIAKAEAIHEAMLEAEYEAMETFEVTEVAIPLDETQTVVAYNKKNEAISSVQVYSSLETGEIEQVVFTDKKHTDVYNVQAGLSGKEVKKLRKEMKHMVKKGQVFLYDDQSNVMYLMHAENGLGEEVTAADVETMEVQSIIWKDKKHHKKHKN
jgi:hypothetical protein